jgi:hypothetical protein
VKDSGQKNRCFREKLWAQQKAHNFSLFNGNHHVRWFCGDLYPIVGKPTCNGMICMRLKETITHPPLDGVPDEKRSGFAATV